MKTWEVLSIGDIVYCLKKKDNIIAPLELSVTNIIKDYDENNQKCMYIDMKYQYENIDMSIHLYLTDEINQCYCIDENNDYFYTDIDECKLRYNDLRRYI